MSRAGWVVVTVLAAMLAAGAGRAADTALPAQAAEVDSFVARLPDAQARDLLIAQLKDRAAQTTGEASGAAMAGGIRGLRDAAQDAAARLREIAGALRAVDIAASRVFDLMTDFRGWPAIGDALLVMLTGLAVGVAIELACRRWARRRLAQMPDGWRLAALRGAVELAAVTASFLGVLVVGLVAFSRTDPLRELVTTTNLAYAAVRLLHAAIGAARLPAAMSLRIGGGILVAGGLYGGLLMLYGLPEPLNAVFLALVGTLAAIAVLPAAWHERFGVFLPVGTVVVWLLWTGNVLLGRPDGAWAAVGFGVLVLAFSEMGGGAAAAETATAAMRQAGLRVLRAGLLIGALACLAVALRLGVFGLTTTPLGERIVRGALNSAVALGLGYFAWTALRVWIAGRLRVQSLDTGASATAVAEGEVSGTKAGTREQTLMPLLRGFASIAIVVLVGFTVLSSFGIDVAPLLAGAGIVGLAIGFGAQSLVRDVVSGVFFLVDDAFRVGEYIEFGTLRGEVEKVSIRSLQLRHHRGALITVPFGEIKALTNYNRDWVILKLKLSLKYGTDVNKVKKIIKRIGEDMLAHPEYGPLFLEPLKSQGILEFGASALILRVKFKCKPREQFVLRRVANERIQQEFAKASIEFAFPTVTVQGPMEAAAAAALPTEPAKAS